MSAKGNSQRSVNEILFQLERFVRDNGYFPCLISTCKTINEEVLVGKLFSHSGLSVYVDKLKSKSYVRRLIKLNNLNDLKIPEVRRVYSGVEEFLRSLPTEKCVVKANHGSAMWRIFDPVSGLKSPTEAELRCWLDTDYSVNSGEHCYRHIKPTLFTEELLENSDTTQPLDIKIHCCRQKPLFIQIIDRSGGQVKRKTYDCQGIEKSWFRNEVLHVNDSNIPFEKSLSYATTLAGSFDYVRVDFYLVDQQLYFSELTFFPMSAAMPFSSFAIDLELGSRLRHARKATEAPNSRSYTWGSEWSITSSMTHLVAYVYFCMRHPRGAIKSQVERLLKEIAP